MFRPNKVALGSIHKYPIKRTGQLVSSKLSDRRSNTQSKETKSDLPVGIIRKCRATINNTRRNPWAAPSRPRAPAFMLGLARTGRISPTRKGRPWLNKPVTLDLRRTARLPTCRRLLISNGRLWYNSQANRSRDSTPQRKDTLALHPQTRILPSFQFRLDISQVRYRISIPI